MHHPPLLLVSILLVAPLLPLPLVQASPDGVRYLGLYWGQNSVKEEVAPGDSGVRLTHPLIGTLRFILKTLEGHRAADVLLKGLRELSSRAKWLRESIQQLLS